MREAARANAQADRNTPYSQAWHAVLGVESRIEGWETANPWLVALLGAEHEQALAAPVVVFEDEPAGASAEP